MTAYFYSTDSNMVLASSALMKSTIFKMRTFVCFSPNPMQIISPSFTVVEALATLSFKVILPLLQASVATVRRLIRRLIFKNLSIRIILSQRKKNGA